MYQSVLNLLPPDTIGVPGTLRWAPTWDAANLDVSTWRESAIRTIWWP